MKLSRQGLNEVYTISKELLDLYEFIELIKPKSLFEHVWRMYILNQRVDHVAAKLNDEGYRIATSSHIGKRKLLHQDVTGIIITDYKINNHPLQLIAYALYNYNFGTLKTPGTIRLIRGARSILISPQFDITQSNQTGMQINAPYIVIENDNEL